MPWPVNVTVTGAAGQVGYALLFRIASGEMFGAGQPIVLRLLEIEPAMKALEGVVMELEDCAFPLLIDIEATSNLAIAFRRTSFALLVGSVPRKPGMERKDLLGVNAGTFKTQGRAIADHAASDVRVLVVGNPCNTNCLIAMNNARPVLPERWFAMTMLDQNRAVAQLAAKSGADTTAITNLAVWGNHSSTMYPDFRNARIGGKPATEVIRDEAWFTETFLPTVQQRGTAIIKARGLSSAASAANAVVDTVRNLTTPTRPGIWFSVSVCSDGSYGIEKGLIFSFPVRSDGQKWQIVQGVALDEFSRSKIVASESELKEEKALVSELIPK